MTDTEISVVLGAALTRREVPGLCARLAELLPRAGESGIVSCYVAGSDLVTVEALARLRVVARRHGRPLVVRGAGPVLLQLVGLLGLTDVLFEPGRQSAHGEQPDGNQDRQPGGSPAADDRGDLAEPGREPEQREQPRDIQEVVDRGDPPG